MSQSLLYHAFGVREGYEYWRTEYADGCVRFFLLVKPELLVCRWCQSRAVRLQLVWHEPLQFKQGRHSVTATLPNGYFCSLEIAIDSARRISLFRLRFGWSNGRVLARKNNSQKIGCRASPSSPQKRSHSERDFGVPNRPF